MVKSRVSIQKTVDFLNELLEIDPFAISALFSSRVSCNKELADHPTVQVGSLGKDSFQVGMIGVLNGLFGIDKHGWGHISGYYEDGKLVEFRLFTDEDVERYVKK